MIMFSPDIDDQVIAARIVSIDAIVISYKRAASDINIFLVVQIYSRIFSSITGTTDGKSHEVQGDVIGIAGDATPGGGVKVPAQIIKPRIIDGTRQAVDPGNHPAAPGDNVKIAVAQDRATIQENRENQHHEPGFPFHSQELLLHEAPVVKQS